MNKILLIIPCYNEENRLDLSEIDSQINTASSKGCTVKLLFANDGSRDKTKEILDSYIQKKSDWAYHATQNAGKAEVIHQAFQKFKSQITDEKFDWIGFWDADLATSIEEIPKMLAYPNLMGNLEVESIWGSRISRLGSVIKRQPHRHYLGRIFVTIVSTVLNVKAYDSQCGAKLFTPKAAELAFKQSFISKWIFDVEILLRLNGLSIVEFPLLRWEDVPGSKVKVFKEALRTLVDLYKIKQAYLKNSGRLAK
jgi:dolichyl-phosphate beta-glucosyltransferase